MKCPENLKVELSALVKKYEAIDREIDERHKDDRPCGLDGPVTEERKKSSRDFWAECTKLFDKYGFQKNK